MKATSAATVRPFGRVPPTIDLASWTTKAIVLGLGLLPACRVRTFLVAATDVAVHRKSEDPRSAFAWLGMTVAASAHCRNHGSTNRAHAK